ncbi:MAG: hypothetical protein ACP5NI_10955 [Acetobacteraceae bacterium]
MSLPKPPVKLPDWVRGRRAGNLALFFVLLAVVALFYAIAVVKMMQAHSIG